MISKQQQKHLAQMNDLAAKLNDPLQVVIDETDKFIAAAQKNLRYNTDKAKRGEPKREMLEADLAAELDKIENDPEAQKRLSMTVHAALWGMTPEEYEEFMGGQCCYCDRDKGVEGE